MAQWIKRRKTLRQSDILRDDDRADFCRYFGLNDVKDDRFAEDWYEMSPRFH